MVLPNGKMVHQANEIVEASINRFNDILISMPINYMKHLLAVDILLKHAFTSIDCNNALRLGSPLTNMSSNLL